MTSNTNQPRTNRIDAAKGIGIALVVYGYVIGGLRGAGIAPKDGALSALFYMTYTLPHAAVLSVVQHVRGDTARESPVRFCPRGFPRIAWPYFLWSIIQLAVVNSLRRRRGATAGSTCTGRAAEFVKAIGIELKIA
jgi:fucose 4-O-acetylase-like acetyltransferase